jgi:ankyrin repeat protein
MRGDREAMELLMQHGADPNAVDRDGDACLHIAAGQRKIA